MINRVMKGIIDTIDRCYSKAAKMNIPPYSLRVLVGPPYEFERIPQEFIAYFTLLCGFQMDWTILDIGCGPGRFARHLIDPPNFFRGYYYGFDVNKRAIDWANQNIATQHANLDFRRVDLYNSHYNPHGKIRPEDFLFPYEDETFDFVFAVSVFTHLLPASTASYLKQISRVLKRRDKALLTFALLDGYPETLSEVARERFSYFGKPINWIHHDGYSVLYPDRPEVIVAYQDAAIKGMMQKNNLSVEKQFHGAWNGAERYLSGQDIFVLCKE